MAEALHTLAMIQQAESPEVGDKALGSQNMALEVRRNLSCDCGGGGYEVSSVSRTFVAVVELRRPFTDNNKIVEVCAFKLPYMFSGPLQHFVPVSKLVLPMYYQMCW